MNIAINKQYHCSPLTIADSAKLVEYCNDAEIYNNTLLIPSPYTEADAAVFLEKTAKKQIEYNAPVVYGIRNTAGELLGIIGIVCKYPLPSHKEEIGYWMGKPHRGKGITTAAVKAFTQYLFEQRSYVRIEAQTYLYNIASQHVLEAAGYELEGILKKNLFKKGVYLDSRLYAKTI